jgi:uncharacterized membrane protein YfcA
MEFYVLLIAFFFIALIYSSVGFGGGSSYLALMGVMAVNMTVMRPAALLCNIVVVTGGTFIFHKEGLLDLKKSWWFFAASIPLAFLGGYWPLKETTFFLALGVTLVVASIFLWIQRDIPTLSDKRVSKRVLLDVGLGGGIGFLSGLVSIGGGIFLSPILHLIRYDDPRKISALASLFILVNSVSGLAGQITRSAEFDWQFIVPLLASVMIGGQIGSRLGARKFNPIYIKRITAVLILAAGLNILKDHL